MERVVEFFTDEAEVWYKDANGVSRLEEGSQMVSDLLDDVVDLYPQAAKALEDCYRSSSFNIPYYKFLRARRFCKCNFGMLDHTSEDIDDGVYHFERIPCPLRGECPYDGVICMPKMDTKLSEAQKRVMNLVCEGRRNDEIAKELFISPNTVKRHISNSYVKVGARNRAEFVKKAKDNGIFL